MQKWMFIAVIALLSTTQTIAQKAEVFSESSAAIRGYDPVAYFTQSKPVKGDAALVYQWKGANWYFSSKKNLDDFKKDPVKYAPQYGGYCAFGCSNGYKAPIDPNAWTIVNGKLYLNYSLGVKEEWNKNRDERIQKADKNWPNIKDKDKE